MSDVLKMESRRSDAMMRRPKLELTRWEARKMWNLLRRILDSDRTPQPGLQVSESDCVTIAAELKRKIEGGVGRDKPHWRECVQRFFRFNLQCASRGGYLVS